MALTVAHMCQTHVAWRWRAVDFEVLAWMSAASNGIVFFGGTDLDSILNWVTTF